MKKLLFLGLFALASLFSTAQNLVAKDATNAFLVFQRGDGIDTYYKINSVKILIDEATIGRIIEANSGIELVGFARTQQVSPNIFDFVDKPQALPTPVISIPQQPVYQIGKVQLHIPGYDAVSAITLADESLKIKDDHRLNIQLATHSISLGENLGDKRSNVDYTITDQTGKVWVEVIQKETTIEGRLGGQFGNNHPDKQYLPQLSEDCNIYLPLGNVYTVSARNKGNMAVDFWIIHPWSSDGTERRLHREDIPPSSVAYYSIDTNLLGLAGMPDYKRTIKINCNGRL